MQPDPSIDYGALSSLERVVGFLISLAGSVALTWVVERAQRVANPDDFKQARNIGLVATAVFIALIFVFLANSQRLVALGTTAAGGVLGCVVFFLWNVWIAAGSSLPKPKRAIAFLGTFMVYLVCGCVGLSAAGLLLYVVQTNTQNQKTSPASLSQPAGQHGVAVNLTGRRIVTQAGATVPFQASSGQVNFGCEQTVTAKTTWQIPPGATVEGEVKVEWANVDNARARSAGTVIGPATVVGEGTITGLELQRIPLGIMPALTNCPGGGHGELVLSGMYVPRTTGEQPYQQTLTGAISANARGPQSVRLTLPGKDVTISTVTVTMTGEGATDTATLTLEPGKTPSPQRSEHGLFVVSIEGDQLIVSRNQT